MGRKKKKKEMKLISYAVEDSQKTGDSIKRKDGRLRKIHTKQERRDRHLHELIQESRLRITANKDYSNSNNHNGSGEVSGSIAEAAVLAAAAAV